jgi:hypothetical protein
MTDISELIEEWNDRDGWFPIPQGCRWFMMEPVDALPGSGIQQCRDCGIYIRDDGSPDGSYISPLMVNAMITVEEEGWCGDGGAQEPWGDAIF